jgi:hypothetical protein
MSNLYKKPAGHTRWSSFENPTAKKGASAHENHGAKGHAFDKIAAGSTISLLDYSESAGIITRMWVTVSNRSQEMLRSLIFRCYWDGADKPAVEAPLGDFFSCGSELCKFENELFSSPEGKSFNAYVPMPFNKSAKITVTNESETDLSHFFYDVNMVALDEPDRDALYFHCYWHRRKEHALGEDFELLPKISGAGRILGTAVVVNTNPVYKKQWWGEGEVKAYIDGDTDLPTLCGTGTEDYIGTGWGQGVYSDRYQGCLMSDYEKLRWVFYRLHVADPVFFHQDIKLTIQLIGGAPAEEVREIMENNAPLIPVTFDDNGTIQHIYKTDKPLPEKGWVNYYRSDDYAAVTWFYLNNKENSLPPIKLS